MVYNTSACDIGVKNSSHIKSIQFLQVDFCFNIIKGLILLSNSVCSMKNFNRISLLWKSCFIFTLSMVSFLPQKILPMTLYMSCIYTGNQALACEKFLQLLNFFCLGSISYPCVQKYIVYVYFS